jgi:hypothetical protein
MSKRKPTLHELSVIALAADMVIAACEDTLEQRLLSASGDLNGRARNADPYELLGTMCAFLAHELKGKDHVAEMTRVVHHISGMVE